MNDKTLHHLFGLDGIPSPIGEAASGVDAVAHDMPDGWFASSDHYDRAAFSDSGSGLDGSGTRPWLQGLNDGQRQAATARGNICVIAGAGTGKTKTLVAAIQDRIAGDRMAPSGMLVATFTRKAAGEMRERLMATGCRLPRYFGTFHSICIRLMRNYPEMVSVRHPGYQLLDDPARLTLVRDFLVPNVTPADMQEIAAGYQMADARAVKISTIAGDFCDIISALKSELITPDELLRDDFDTDRLPHHLAAHIEARPGAWFMARLYFGQYETLMARKNALDYEDIINLPLRAMERSSRLRDIIQAQIHTVMVDEFQDCSVGQKRLAEMLGGGGSLFAVGDDGQSIYGWRGAHVDFIRQWAQTPGVASIRLEQNYRSTNGILNIGQILLSYDLNAIQKTLVAAGPNAADLSIPAIIQHDDSVDEFAFLADDIARRVAHGESTRSMAVLVRSKWLGQRAMNALIKKGVPAKLEDGSMWDRKEIRFLTAASLMILNENAPANILRLQDLFSSGLLPTGVGKTGFQALLADAERNGVAAAITALARKNRKVSVLVQALAGLQESCASEADIGVVIDRIFTETGLKMALERTQKKLQDKLDVAPRHEIGKIQDEITAIAGRFDAVQSLVDIAASAESLEDLMTTSMLGRDHRSDENAVTISTIHGAKGLEWESVYLPGFTGAILGLRRAEASADPDYGEACRLAYVAVTRARRNLLLSWSRRYYESGADHYPCALLHDVPATQLKTIRVTPRHAKPSWHGTRKRNR